jgi:hypothetical protein
MSTRDLPVPLIETRMVERETGLSLSRVLALRWQACLTRSAAEATLVILAARHRVAQAGIATEEVEAELELRREVRAADPEARITILGQETEVERLLLERERLRSQRLNGAGAVMEVPLPAPTGVEWDIDDRQIEAMAVKAVTRFAALPPAQAAGAWAAWERELKLRLPPYAAAEVLRRVEALRAMAR